MSVKIFHIGIAGAGISGLMAGLEILSAGHAATIFESRSRAGGRIQSFDLDGIVVETGPEFIHGHLKETIGLLKKYNIRYDPVDGKNYTSNRGILKESTDWDEGWDLLVAKMKSIKEDLPLGEFLEKNFPGNQFRSLRQTAIGFAEGFDLADIKTVSTHALYREWEHGESEQYQFLQDTEP
jgi:phytoene dehydrogenase-like protein